MNLGVNRLLTKENIEQRSTTRCFPEGRKNFAILFFIIGNSVIVTLAEKLHFILFQ